MDKIKISLNKISKSFEKENGDKKVVLNHCDVKIFDGKIHAILGDSGSGKSVLLKIILGLLNQDSGEVFFEENLITEKNIFDILLSKSGVLFQNNALFDSKNVYENIIFPFLGLETSKYEKQDKSKEFVSKILEKVGLYDPGILDLDINEISGGMQKRVAIARAMIKNPQIVFLDEPTSGLDIENSKLIFDLIEELNKKYSITFLIITHDVFFAPKISNYIYLFEDHKLNLVSRERIHQKFCSDI